MDPAQLSWDAQTDLLHGGTGQNPALDYDGISQERLQSNQLVFMAPQSLTGWTYPDDQTSPSWSLTPHNANSLPVDPLPFAPSEPTQDTIPKAKAPISILITPSRGDDRDTLCCWNFRDPPPVSPSTDPQSLASPGGLSASSSGSSFHSPMLTPELGLEQLPTTNSSPFFWPAPDSEANMDQMSSLKLDGVSHVGEADQGVYRQGFSAGLGGESPGPLQGGANYHSYTQLLQNDLMNNCDIGMISGDSCCLQLPPPSDTAQPGHPTSSQGSSSTQSLRRHSTSKCHQAMPYPRPRSTSESLRLSSVFADDEHLEGLATASDARAFATSSQLHVPRPKSRGRNESVARGRPLSAGHLRPPSSSSAYSRSRSSQRGVSPSNPTLIERNRVDEDHAARCHGGIRAQGQQTLSAGQSFHQNMASSAAYTTPQAPRHPSQIGFPPQCASYQDRVDRNIQRAHSRPLEFQNASSSGSHQTTSSFLDPSTLFQLSSASPQIPGRLGGDSQPTGESLAVQRHPFDESRYLQSSIGDAYLFGSDQYQYGDLESRRETSSFTTPGEDLIMAPAAINSNTSQAPYDTAPSPSGHTGQDTGYSRHALKIKAAVERDWFGGQTREWKYVIQEVIRRLPYTRGTRRDIAQTLLGHLPQETGDALEYVEPSAFLKYLDGRIGHWLSHNKALFSRNNRLWSVRID